MANKKKTPLPQCSSCGSKNGDILYSAQDFDGAGEDYQLYQCPQCQLTQTTPVPTQEKLADSYNIDYYGDKTSKFSYVIERWSLFAARKRVRKLIKLHGAKAQKLRILDIGCGRGVLLKALKSLGHDVVGVERKDSPFSNIPDVVCGDLDTINFKAESFDIIILWHVLEHLDEPAKVLSQINHIQKKEGSLFISVPNFGSIQASIFKKHWFHLDLPRHLFHFDEQAIQNMLKNTDMQITHRGTTSFDQNVYGFIQSTLNMVPGLKNNHLYGLLKSGVNPKTLLLLMLYSPLVAILFATAMIELIISASFNKGASLNLQIKKTNND
jgi:2-polyprenyl-3-methyl-5-hydroxy-6-metoxy-1,4-benzoquinol methylase